ncbi:AAA family ATPase [Anabaena sp. CCY 9910]|uniref:AAA family ATPase n=1 Tax=Anabaena sp. CCY 9910 TaxID=3103870 RepID=UPI0039E14739
MAINYKIQKSNIQNQFVVMMAGLPGVGKSLIARELAQILKIPLIDKDDILDEIKHISVLDRSEQGRLAYDILFQILKRQLSLELSVIVDTCLTFDWLRKNLLEHASKYKAIPVIVLCECPSEVARDRIANRIRDDKDTYAERTWEEHERIKKMFAPLNEWTHLKLDTCLDPSENAMKIAEHLLHTAE